MKYDEMLFMKYNKITLPQPVIYGTFLELRQMLNYDITLMTTIG